MSDPVAIETATAADVYALEVVHRHCFDEGWTASSLTALLTDPLMVSLVSRKRDAIVGFVLCRVLLDEAEVFSLAVEPASRRNGVARRMLTVVCDEARRRGAGSLVLEVAADNSAARALYAGFGLREVAVRHGYYTRDDNSTVDGLIMRGTL
jgi:ribosomal-protein-alanine N-acetyltransferase